MQFLNRSKAVNLVDLVVFDEIVTKGNVLITSARRGLIRYSEAPALIQPNMKSKSSIVEHTNELKCKQIGC